jgi:ABC-type cobalamin/Fe3+-siderophores transport system ATPase subunit
LVEQWSKRFGDRVAFDDVSFEVDHGEVFGFLGPNGAGKTTMVRTLGDAALPSAGAAFVGGISLAPDTGVEIRRRIAILLHPLVVVFALPASTAAELSQGSCCWTWGASRRSCRQPWPPTRWSASASRHPGAGADHHCMSGSVPKQ